MGSYVKCTWKHISSPKVTQIGEDELGSNGNQLPTKQKYLFSNINTLVSVEIVKNIIYWHLRLCFSLQIKVISKCMPKLSYLEVSNPKVMCLQQWKARQQINQVHPAKNDSEKFIFLLILWKTQVAKPE